MPRELLPLLLLLLPLLVLSGVFSGSETALFRLGRRDRERLRSSYPGSARSISALLDDPGGVLVTILLLNMVVNVLYFVIVSVITMHTPATLGKVSISLGSLLALILLGEVLAKLLAGARRVQFVALLAPTLLLLHRGLTPLRLGVWGVVQALIRLLVPGGIEERAASPEQLRALIGLGRRQGVLDPEEERILGRVVALSSRRVREIMTPRVGLPYLDLESSYEDAVELARRSDVTNVPAAIGGLDSGTPAMIDLRRAIAHAQAHGNWDPRSKTRAAVFLPENIRLDRALTELREKGEHAALCVDEHGAISGMIEIEGLVRALALTWAPDSAGGQIQIVGVGVWEVSARLGVRDFGGLFPSLDGTESGVVDAADSSPIEASTLGGVLQEALGRVPRIGDEIPWRGYLLRVVSAGPASADRLLVTDPRGEGAEQ